MSGEMQIPALSPNLANKNPAILRDDASGRVSRITGRVIVAPGLFASLSGVTSQRMVLQRKGP